MPPLSPVSHSIIHTGSFRRYVRARITCSELRFEPRSQALIFGSQPLDLDVRRPVGRGGRNFRRCGRGMTLSWLTNERQHGGGPVIRGRKGGRPRKLSDEDLVVGRAMLTDPTIPVSKVAERLGISRQSLYRYFPAARSAGKAGN